MQNSGHSKPFSELLVPPAPREIVAQPMQGPPPPLKEVCVCLFLIGSPPPPPPMPSRPGSLLENHGFDPFLSHLWSQIGPFNPLSALRGAKIAQHGLKMGSFHLFVHPK